MDQVIYNLGIKIWTKCKMNNKCNLWGMNKWMHQNANVAQKVEAYYNIKLHIIDCAKRPNYVFNHSPSDTMGSKCSQWWQSWTCSIVRWSCFHTTIMAINNPKLLPTQNKCTYTNYNILWFVKPTTKSQHQFGTH